MAGRAELLKRDTVRTYQPKRKTAKANGKDDHPLINAKGEVAFADPDRLFGKVWTGQYNPSVLASRHGLRIFDRMKRDDQVKAALLFKKMAVLSTGWEIGVPEGEDKEWEPAKFIERRLKDIEGSFRDALLGILTALEYGFSVSEMVLREIEGGEDKGMIGLKAIKTRKPHSFDFNADEFGNLGDKGLIQNTPKGQQALPRYKFIIFVPQFEFGNWYGVSDLEACYRAYWLKENVYRWLGMMLERFGVPPIFALYDPTRLNDTQIAKLVQVVNRIQAATSGAIPRTSKDALEMWAPELAGQTGTVFIPALNMLNRDISRGLLMPGLIGMTPDASVGSLARSQVHFDSFIMIAEHLRLMLAETVQEEIVVPLTDINFGDDQYPVFKFLPFTDELSVELMDSWTKLITAGTVQNQESDEAHVRALYKFPEIEEDREEDLPELPGEGEPGEPSPEDGTNPEERAAEPDGSIPEERKPLDRKEPSPTSAKPKEADRTIPAERKRQTRTKLGAPVKVVASVEAHNDSRPFRFNPRQARDRVGRWSKQGGAGPLVSHGGKWTRGGAAIDDAMSDRIRQLRIPPGWKSVELNPDESAALQAIGVDVKGRKQYVYSAEHSAKASAEKFDRLKQFHKERPQIMQKVAQDLNSRIPEREHALLIRLIDKTGIRVGSDRETGGAVKAYGATTLEADHVDVKGNTVTLKFTGKKGVNIEKSFDDDLLASEFKARKTKGGRLFLVSDSQVRDYLHARDGDFKVKDFRTWNGTSTALNEIARMPVPKTKKDFVKQRKAVATAVAKHLGNTPTVALASYIDPAVWAKWERF